MEASTELRVKDEAIYDSQSISDTRKVTLSSNSVIKRTNKLKRHSILEKEVKKEPKDIEMQTSSFQIESRSEDVEIKAEKEEKFANKISIAFLNEETTTTISDDNVTITNQSKTSNNEPNNPRNKKSK